MPAAAIGHEIEEVVVFRPQDGGLEHLAVLIGEPEAGAPVLTRLHSECFTGDLLGFTGPKAATFEVVIQLGAILAVVVLYWDRFWGLLYQPLARAVKRAAALVGRLQTGRISVYLAYSFVTLIVLLVIVL